MSESEPSINPKTDAEASFAPVPEKLVKHPNTAEVMAHRSSKLIDIKLDDEQYIRDKKAELDARVEAKAKLKELPVMKRAVTVAKDFAHAVTTDAPIKQSITSIETEVRQAEMGLPDLDDRIEDAQEDARFLHEHGLDPDEQDALYKKLREEAVDKKKANFRPKALANTLVGGIVIDERVPAPSRRLPRQIVNGTEDLTQKEFGLSEAIKKYPETDHTKEKDVA